MVGSVTLGNPASAWEFGWEALAAIGTLAAVVTALLIHFLQIRSTREADRERRIRRTRILAPLLAADAMQTSWSLLTVMRSAKQLGEMHMTQRSAHLIEMHKNNRLSIGIMPGANVNSNDYEWLTDDVRELLVAFRAQVAVCDGMWTKLAIGPIEPHADRNGAVSSLLVHAATQVEDTHRTMLALMEALKFSLPAQLVELKTSMERNSAGFELIVVNLRAVHQRENLKAR